MNVVDAILLVVFLIVFSLGFYAGLGRLVAGFVALLGGLIVAGIFYQSVAGQLSPFLGSPADWISDVVAFLLILFVVCGALLYSLLWSFRITPLRTRRVLEMRGGFPAIFIVALLAVVLGFAIVTTLVQVSDWSVTQMDVSGTRVTMGQQLDESVLARGSRRLTPYLCDATGAWMPGGEPPILRPVTQ